MHMLPVNYLCTCSMPNPHIPEHTFFIFSIFKSIFSLFQTRLRLANIEDWALVGSSCHNQHTTQKHILGGEWQGAMAKWRCAATSAGRMVPLKQLQQDGLQSHVFIELITVLLVADDAEYPPSYCMSSIMSTWSHLPSKKNSLQRVLNATSSGVISTFVSTGIIRPTLVPYPGIPSKEPLLNGTTGSAL